MKQSLIVTQHAPRLLLFFAGWGMDETLFLHLRQKECDVMICYDYRKLDFDTTPLNGYQEIHIIAWSMGVWAASQVLQHHALPITRSIAINGTPYPVDEERGIPPAIFEGTLNGLSTASLLKFQSRMCGSSEAFKGFQTHAPQRPLEELKEELAAIGQQCCTLPPSDFVWEQAYIGNRDRIFPPQAQQRAWEGNCSHITHGNEAHYDDSLFRQLLEGHTTIRP